ncbi:hypothetical protein E2542_SST30226 [Spatholobus suberectus]|nr:hypothetical protein E2542_SST30226 [Spatholobus suberectus]
MIQKSLVPLVPLSTRQRRLQQSQFKRAGSASERSNSKSLVSADSRMVGSLMDEVNIRAVITYCPQRRRKDSGDKVVVNIELGVKKVDRLVENQGTKEQFVIICEGSHRFQIATCGDIDIIITQPHRRRYCLISYNIYSLLKKIFIYTEVFLNSN